MAKGPLGEKVMRKGQVVAVNRILRALRDIEADVNALDGDILIEDEVSNIKARYPLLVGGAIRLKEYVSDPRFYVS